MQKWTDNYYDFLQNTFYMAIIEWAIEIKFMKKILQVFMTDFWIILTCDFAKLFQRTLHAKSLFLKF